MPGARSRLFCAARKIKSGFCKFDIDKLSLPWYNVTVIGVWLSPVECLVRDQEAAGSNPVTPIKRKQGFIPCFSFYESICLSPVFKFRRLTSLLSCSIAAQANGQFR